MIFSSGHLSSTPGFFPAAADPATHLASVPFARTLGFVWERGDADGVCIRMPFSAATRDATGTAVNPLATLALLDHVCSAAVYLSLERPSLIATIDLRTEFAHAQDSGDVVCTARTQFIDGAFALVRGQAVSQTSGQVVAYCSSAYAIGSHPGMQGKNSELRQHAALQDQRHASFAAMLGMQAAPEGAGGMQMPFNDRLVGALSLPAVHGGATGAALVTTALAHAQAQGNGPVWRPLTVTVHYLRAVQASTLTLLPAIRRTGKRHCVVGVSAVQGAHVQDVAHAECLLVRTGTGGD